MHRVVSIENVTTMRNVASRSAACSHGTGIFEYMGPLTGGRQPDIFAHLDEQSLHQVRSRGRRLDFERGTELFRQGEEHKGIFLIETGCVRTYYTSPAGREITLAYWRPGNIVGTPDVFGGSTHMWSGMAVEDTDVLVFCGEDLRELMTRYAALAIGVVEALTFKGQCFSTLVQILGTRSVGQRLAQVLLALCNLYGVRENGGVSIGAPFTHEDLAHMVGASRQWVTTTLDRLQRRGIVVIRKRRITVLRADLLAAPHNKSAASGGILSTN